MIYLKPIGGLCNRMRTVDSFISICAKNNQDLTILWVLDDSLNCSYHELFNIPIVKDFNIKVIDCPVGYPESFLKEYGNKTGSSFKYKSDELRMVRNLKNLIKGRLLDKFQKSIIVNIGKIPFDNIILNHELSIIYNAFGSKESARVLDSQFLNSVKQTFSFTDNINNDFYITSCYRMYPLENAYLNFIPKNNLVKRINSRKQDYSNTYGLHIRRSDHTVSKNVSTTKLFEDKINELMKKENNASFFLSTDDEKTKSDLLNRFGERILVNPISNYNRNHPAAIKDAVVDLYSLSFTKKIYGSHQSSFSQTAADIGGIQEVTVK